MHASKSMQILVAEPFDDPEVGFGLQQAVLEEVAAGERSPTALIWTSTRYVGATRQETRLPGFSRLQGSDWRNRCGPLGTPALA